MLKILGLQKNFEEISSKWIKSSQMIRITEKDVCEKKKIFNFVQRSSGPP